LRQALANALFTHFAGFPLSLQNTYSESNRRKILAKTSFTAPFMGISRRSPFFERPTMMNPLRMSTSPQVSPKISPRLMPVFNAMVTMG